MQSISKFPNAIVANQTRQIKYNAEGELLDYKFWVNNDKSKVDNVFSNWYCRYFVSSKITAEI